MTSERRFRICKLCKYAKQHPIFGVTCGTLDILSLPPIVGETVWIGGKPVKLCGCVMKIKTTLPDSTCPLKKW